MSLQIVKCPNCGVESEVDFEQDGQEFKCPFCEKTFTMSGATNAKPSIIPQSSRHDLGKEVKHKEVKHKEESTKQGKNILLMCMTFLLILILGGGIVFYLKTKGKAVPQVQESNKTDQKSNVIKTDDASLQEDSNKSLKGLFGYKFGEVLQVNNEELIEYKGYCLEGERAIEISPRKPFMNFSSCMLVLTPDTHRIYRIAASCSFETDIRKTTLPGEYQAYDYLKEVRDVICGFCKINPSDAVENKRDSFKHTFDDGSIIELFTYKFYDAYYVRLQVHGNRKLQAIAATEVKQSVGRQARKKAKEVDTSGLE